MHQNLHFQLGRNRPARARQELPAHPRHDFGEKRGEGSRGTKARPGGCRQQTFLRCSTHPLLHRLMFTFLYFQNLSGCGDRAQQQPATATQPSPRFTRPGVGSVFRLGSLAYLERRLRQDAARVWSAGQPENPNRASANVTWDEQDLP